MLPDFFACSHTPYLHARGRSGTLVLLNELRPTPGQRLLELGFGTGQTLVDIAARFPETALYGLEKSPAMLHTARQRMRFCGLTGIHLDLYDSALPHGNHFFDAVYCESVLAIVPDKELPGIFKEIYRVLKPGGRFYCNESLWLKTASAETIRPINRKCLEAFGIVQASEKYPYPENWGALGASAGFHLQKIQSLENIANHNKHPLTRIQFLSIIFSRFGWLKGRLHPRLNRARRQWRKQERSFKDYGRFLEGYLIVFQKPPLL